MARSDLVREVANFVRDYINAQYEMTKECEFTSEELYAVVAGAAFQKLSYALFADALSAHIVGSRIHSVFETRIERGLMYVRLSNDDRDAPTEAPPAPDEPETDSRDPAT